MVCRKVGVFGCTTSLAITRISIKCTTDSETLLQARYQGIIVTMKVVYKSMIIYILLQFFDNSEIYNDYFETGKKELNRTKVIKQGSKEKCIYALILIKDV